MSELQLGLIVIGVLVVAAVYLFNWYQDRRFRQRVENAFREGPDDALLAPRTAAPEAAQRVEPHLGPNEPAEAVEASNAPAAAAPAPAAVEARSAEVPPQEPVPVAAFVTPDSPIDYVCVVESATPVPPASLQDFLRHAAAVGKPVHLSGWHAEREAWVALQAGSFTTTSRVCLGLQLVNRTGAAKRVQIASFRDMARQFAERIGAQCECPDIDSAAQRSGELDRFCADVDVSVGFHLVAREGEAIAGRKLRGLAVDSGFRLEPEGWFSLRSDDQLVLITLGSQDGTPFERDRLDDLMLPGVTLLLDVPRVPDGVEVFDRTIELGRRMADNLDALVVDDNRVALAAAGVEKIRAHLRNVCTAMRSRGIEPGSAIALRLFS